MATIGLLHERNVPSRAMADGVGRKVVNGENHVYGTARGKPGPARLGQHLRSQLVQRTGTNRPVKIRCHAISRLEDIRMA